MRKHVLFIIVLLVAHCIKAQYSISLEMCQQKAHDNYPLIQQYELIKKSEGYTLSNISKSYLPQFSINAQATYQSEVTKFPLDFSTLGIPANINPVSKDEYKATIEASQLLWDGGNTKSRQNITKANTEIAKQQTTVSLYQIREKVNQLYFGILAINEQIELLKILEQDLNTNRKNIQSMFANGTVSQSDVDLIEIELLNVAQNKIEQNKIKESFMQMLSLYIAENVDDKTILKKPLAIASNINDDINRPELNLFGSQRTAVDSQLEAISAKNRPTIRLFGQVGYGRPGFNMLEDKFKMFAIGGIKLSWNFGNLYTRENEKKQMTIERNNIDVQENIFLFNIKLRLTQENSEALKLKKQLEKDTEIINLYGRVKKAGESKYRNGVYQTSDLLKDINAENRAKQSKALREIQYLQSIYNQQFIKGY